MNMNFSTAKDDHELVSNYEDDHELVLPDRDDHKHHQISQAWIFYRWHLDNDSKHRSYKIDRICEIEFVKQTKKY